MQKTEDIKMKTATIYSRVSTDSQEREGTSLQTQMENCLSYCHEKGYEVAYRFSEAYSGLSLERPDLEKLRELVRNEAVDVIVCYSLDRLTRDPGHGVILTQELEKHGVKLETVTEDVESTDLGRLITYIRHFASKLEAEKIKERTVRGRKARALEGKIPHGGFSGLYGYDYDKVNKKRTINETEAGWVRKIFGWLVDEGLTTGSIRDRLIASGAPTKTGKAWRRSTVLAIARNPGFAGKTYAFTSLEHRVRQKPREEWIEIPGATPAIVSQGTFEAAQKQLRENQITAIRNTKREYLLRSHIKCRQCGYAYTGGTSGKKREDGSYKTIYVCGGRSADRGLPSKCRNRRWSSSKLETIVFARLEECLRTPELITRELVKQRQEANQLGIFESQLEEEERQLRAVDRDQQQLLRWALKGFPEDQVETENKKLNKAREVLKAQIVEIEDQIRASKDAIDNIPNLEQFIERMKGCLSTLDFEGKRQMLDMLDITVWLEGENVEITGVIPVTDGVVVTTPS
jgi:site-specific DNA recombinase